MIVILDILKVFTLFMCCMQSALRDIIARRGVGRRRAPRDIIARGAVFSLLMYLYIFVYMPIYIRKSDWRRTEITYRCNRTDRLVAMIEAERKFLKSDKIANLKLTGCGSSGQTKAGFIKTFFCLMSDRISAPANFIAKTALNTRTRR